MGSKGKKSSSGNVKVDLMPIEADEKPDVDEVKQAKYSEVADKTVIKESKKKVRQERRIPS